MQHLRTTFGLNASPHPAMTCGINCYSRTLVLMAPHVFGHGFYTVSPVLTALRSATPPMPKDLGTETEGDCPNVEFW